MEDESNNALETLGITERIYYDYEVRYFPDYRQAILEDLVRLKEDIAPDLVVAPSVNDWHQDHQTVGAECMRAFRDTNMILYKHPWNCSLDLNVDYFVKVDDLAVGRKAEAVDCYRSQRDKLYTSKEYIYAMARWYGALCGAEFAEGFKVFKLIV
jgi:LmbE family N-acetylglucosaminyl deacetylase